MILGTWNLETYPSPGSPKGMAMLVETLDSHQADLWFLTELHSEFRLTGFEMAFAPPRDNAPHDRRKAAIASRLPLNVIEGPDHPAEGRICLARIEDPSIDDSLLAASAVAPWRGSTPWWRALLGEDLSYADVFELVLGYFVKRIMEERRPGEPLVWGGDFNQGLFDRDYVGTRRGRKALMSAFDAFDLRVPTMTQPALIASHPAIDHIAIPAHWGGSAKAAVHRPTHNGKNLSDHALYVVDANPFGSDGTSASQPD